MATLNELKISILADGKIDELEVSQIEKVIFQDGKIDTDEANFLFDLNDGCSGAENHSSWSTLFVKAICSYLLEDEKSPGIVDEDEAKWLLKKLQSDGKIDGTEKKLLQEISKSAKSMPESLKKLIGENI